MELARAKTRRPALRTEVVPPSPIIDYAMLEGRAPTKEQVRIQAEKILQSDVLSCAQIERANCFNTSSNRRLSVMQNGLSSIQLQQKRWGEDRILTQIPTQSCGSKRASYGALLRTTTFVRAQMSPIRISIPKGSYMPTFELVDWKSVDPGSTAPARSIS